MSTVNWLSVTLGGLGGATLAIVGNFLVQRAAARREQRRYVANLAADFLAHTAAVIWNMSAQRRSSDESTLMIGGGDLTIKAINAAQELTLISNRGLTMATNRVLGVFNAMMLVSVQDDDAAWKNLLREAGAHRLEFMHQARRAAHSSRMTDDDLGHDEIDPDAPSTTYSPGN